MTTIYNTLGINPGHNGSVALVSNGEVVYYIEEERLSRQKYDGNPFRGVLDIIQRGFQIDEIIIGGTTNELPTLPWTNENPYSALVRKFFPNVKTTILGNEHHIGHVACAFYNSGFDKSIVVIVDGAGSYHQGGFEAESIWVADYPNVFKLVKRELGDNIGPRIESDVITSDSAVTITKAYEAVTDYLGFGFIEAGKTMGLSSYGKFDDSLPDFFIGNRGNKNVFIPHYPAGARIDAVRNPELAIDSIDTDTAKNVAWKIQQNTQKLVGDMIEWAIRKTGINNVCIAGGYGLNCVANYYIKRRFPNINLYHEPISHDGGTAIGLAKLAWYSQSASLEKYPQTAIYYGPRYEPQLHDFAINLFENDINVSKVTYSDVAQLIADRNIVALYHGRSEAGPRALGNRSILYDPRDPNGKDFVNQVKGREWFRPFAGSVLVEHATKYFDMAGLTESPYMMYAVNVLSSKKDQIPAITHVDGTCRIQTVNKTQNSHYYNLISAFNDITDIPILFNTSFNLAGDPLVETPIDAIQTLFKSRLNYLYFPEFNVLIEKKIKL